MAEEIDGKTLAISISADLKRLDKNMKDAVARIKVAGEKMEAQAAATGKRMDAALEKSTRGIKAALAGGAGLGVVTLTKQLLRLTDTWISASNKLAASGVATAQVSGRMNELTDMANRTRTSLEATADLYAKLTRASGELGLSQQQVAQMTETVNKAFIAGGASVSEQQAAILQLSQALGSGVLQGDELRSIRENAPLLAKAIADEFGVSIAGLKKLGADGALTSDRVAKAILNASGRIDSAFGKTKSTVEQAGTVFWNELTRFIATCDNAVGASQAFAAILNAVARNIDLVAGAAVALTTILTARLAAGGIAAAYRALISFSTQLAAASAMSVSLGTTATRTGAILAGMGGGLLRIFGGPIGLAITAVGVAIGAYATSVDDAAQSQQQFDTNNQKISAGLELVAQWQGKAGDATRDLADNLQSAGANMDTAALSAEGAAAANRAYAIETIRAAQAAAFLNAQMSGKKVAELDAKITELKPMVPEDPYDTSGKYDPAHRDAYDAAIKNRNIEQTLKDSYSKASDELWNSLQKIMSDPIAFTKPTAAGGGGGGGTKPAKGNAVAKAAAREAEQLRRAVIDSMGEEARITEELRKRIEELNEARAKGLTIDGKVPDYNKLIASEKAKAAKEIEELRKRQFDTTFGAAADMSKRVLDQITQKANETRDSFKGAFRGAIEELKQGNEGGAVAAFFQPFVDRMSEQAMNALYDGFASLLGQDTMSTLFGPLDAAQVAQATSLQQMTNATVQATVALQQMAASAGGGGSKGGILTDILNGISGIVGGPSNQNGTRSSGPTSQRGTPGRRAMGGPVTAGHPYIVGENRPELFVPNQSGNIIPFVPRIPQAASPRMNMTFAPILNMQGSGPQEVAAMKAELANQRAAFQRWAEGERGRVTGHVTDAMSRRQVRQR